MIQSTWSYKYFSTLSAEELYDILQLRSRVFVVEQNCVYLDTDEKDQHAYHLCCWCNKDLAAYARIIPPGIAFAEASIGRVVTAPEYRKTGVGRELMKRAIEETYKTFKTNTIKIGAQLYLKKFYTELGFLQCSDTYIEDGIPHIEMLHSL